MCPGGTGDGENNRRLLAQKNGLFFSFIQAILAEVPPRSNHPSGEASRAAEAALDLHRNRRLLFSLACLPIIHIVSPGFVSPHARETDAGIKVTTGRYISDTSRAVREDRPRWEAALSLDAVPSSGFP
jgi:hypothetical protein